jgi:hypothetical protein
MRSTILPASCSLRRVSDATAQTEFIFAEELISEGWSGPNLDYVERHARGLRRLTYHGGTISDQDVDSLVALLGDPTAFLNTRTERLNHVSLIRKMVTEVLLVQARRTDDGVLVGRLRAVTNVYLSNFPGLQPMPPRILHALFDGFDTQDLAVRDAAMRMCSAMAAATDLTPVLDVVIGQLDAPKSRQGRRTFAPGVAAREGLITFSLTAAADLDDLCTRVAAEVSRGSDPDLGPLRTLAALHTVRQQFDRVTALNSSSASRTALVGGIRDAVHAIAWNLGLKRPVPDTAYPFAVAIEVAAGLATTAANRAEVAKLRARYIDRPSGRRRPAGR